MFCHSIFTEISGAHFFKIQEIDEENNDEEDEEDDEVNGHEEEDLIELTTCGITTQWLFPDKCRVCPVGNCRQHFRTRLDGIKHFRESHTIGSICCPGKMHLS